MTLLCIVGEDGIDLTTTVLPLIHSLSLPGTWYYRNKCNRYALCMNRRARLMTERQAVAPSSSCLLSSNDACKEYGISLA